MEKIQDIIVLTSAAIITDLINKRIDLMTAVTRIEKCAITISLQRTKNNKTQAAKSLGIGRTTLIMKAKKMGIKL
jgi:transcriptional regulator with PAS, ATPase and Fis domain